MYVHLMQVFNTSFKKKLGMKNKNSAQLQCSCLRLHGNKKPVL